MNRESKGSPQGVVPLSLLVGGVMLIVVSQAVADPITSHWFAVAGFVMATALFSISVFVDVRRAMTPIKLGHPDRRRPIVIGIRDYE